jgi:primosomal protein N' (replication factor Y)
VSGEGRGWTARGTIASARRLRREATDAERHLWSALRRSALGAAFRRQHPIPPHIADFACVEGLVVVEVDGGQHGGARDLARDVAMQGAGWLVLRFWNNEVLENLPGVTETIARALAHRLGR